MQFEQINSAKELCTTKIFTYSICGIAVSWGLLKEQASLTVFSQDAEDNLHKKKAMQKIKFKKKLENTPLNSLNCRSSQNCQQSC